jgi:hypothetical protein
MEGATATEGATDALSNGLAAAGTEAVELAGGGMATGRTVLGAGGGMLAEGVAMGIGGTPEEGTWGGFMCC